MKQILLLLNISIFIAALISCNSTQKVHTEATDPATLQALRDIADYQIHDSIATKMINYFSACADSSCKNPVILTDREGILEKILTAHPRWTVEIIRARFKDKNDETRYCNTRRFPANSDSCGVAGYSTDILKVSKRRNTTAYYSFKKLCPPPTNCAAAVLPVK